MVNILLYILGAIAVFYLKTAGIYFFMRREPSPKSAADIARAQSQQDPTPEPQEEPTQEETTDIQSQNLNQNQSNQFKRKLRQKLLRKNLNQKIMINHLIMTMRIIIDN